MNGAYRSPVKPAPPTRSSAYLFMLSFMHCAALLSSGNICDGTSLKSSLLIVPEKGNGTWEFGVVHRRARARSDVKRLVNRQEDRSSVDDTVVREILAVHFQHAGAALGHARVSYLKSNSRVCSRG